jgi:hypothetical protein
MMSPLGSLTKTGGLKTRILSISTPCLNTTGFPFTQERTRNSIPPAIVETPRISISFPSTECLPIMSRELIIWHLARDFSELVLSKRMFSMLSGITT